MSEIRTGIFLSIDKKEFVKIFKKYGFKKKKRDFELDTHFPDEPAHKKSETYDNFFWYLKKDGGTTTQKIRWYKEVKEKGLEFQIEVHLRKQFLSFEESVWRYGIIIIKLGDDNAIENPLYEPVMFEEFLSKIL